MRHPLRKKRSILAVFLTLSLLLAVYQYIELRDPPSVDAQCTVIPPETIYFFTVATAWSPAQECFISNHTSPNFATSLVTGPRNFAVALTGWQLINTDDDDEWLVGAVEILDDTIVSNGNNFSFQLRTCLGDSGPDKGHMFQVRFVAFAWPS